MFDAIIALFIRQYQYCRWIDCNRLYNTWKLIEQAYGALKLNDDWKFLLMPPQLSYPQHRIIVLKYITIHRFEWCLFTVWLWSMPPSYFCNERTILGVDATWLLIANLLTKCRSAYFGLAFQEIRVVVCCLLLLCWKRPALPWHIFFLETIYFI
jgi:hypothetical protein